MNLFLKRKASPKEQTNSAFPTLESISLNNFINELPLLTTMNQEWRGWCNGSIRACGANLSLEKKASPKKKVLKALGLGSIPGPRPELFSFLKERKNFTKKKELLGNKNFTKRKKLK